MKIYDGGGCLCVFVIGISMYELIPLFYKLIYTRTQLRDIHNSLGKCAFFLVFFFHFIWHSHFGCCCPLKKRNVFFLGMVRYDKEVLNQDTAIVKQCDEKRAKFQGQINNMALYVM